MESRRGALAVVGLSVAVLACWVNGILVRTVTVHVQFLGAEADRSDYRVAAGAGVMTAVLLLLGVFALVVLGSPAWLVYASAGAMATQLALGVTAWWSSRAVDDTVVLTRSVWDGVRDVLVLPGSWPLLAVLVVAVVVRVRSSRAPR
ncbi:hypothetical protein G5V58_00875 [Nocardioides anomalus]|uniref:Uncharacterized protein n=1 Tax=Nocardioides anomalus TaxID=2712223 RepID=A0A6G6W8G7_9ACTN|nr:hypothetical protein [Nocardioides anomalus]QIG41512.1 hypothetical protein G5V58_00875 [Nocardioides anomalus]